MEGESQAEVRVNAALVELVEDHEPDPLQGGIRLDQPGQDALGEDLDPGGRAHRRFVPDPVADQLPDLLSGQCGHTTRRRPGGQAPGLEHQDSPALEPGLGQQAERHPGGLPGSGGGLEHGPAALQERYPEGGKQIVYREGGQEGHRTTISPLWNRIRADPVVMGELARCLHEQGGPTPILGRRERRLVPT